MPARTVPERPVFATPSEQAVWERLVAQAPDDWTVVANLVLVTEHREHECDLLVLMPDVGIVVLEVKGGSISVTPDGRWHQTTARYGDRVIDPVTQVTGNKYVARRYVEEDPRWRDSSRVRVRWGHSLVLPHTELADDFSLPDCPRWAVHAKGDQGDLAGRLYDIAASQEGGHRVPSAEDCDLVVDILMGRSLPLRDVVAIADERADTADRLTAEQQMLLDVTRLLHRVEIRGGAGSGKTVLALTQAKDLTRGTAGREPQRVALLCYSIGLATWFQRYVSSLPHRQRPAFVGTFEDFARYLGVTEFGTRQDAEFWEEALPRQMAELVADLPEGKRFDAVVIDEAQDFADLWWRPVLGALKDEETGGVYLYSDEGQRVFQRFGRPPVALVPLVLDHNLRNTRQIADVFSPLTPIRMRALGGDGPDVVFVPASTEDALDVADDQVDVLLEEGWRPEHVALITTGRRHPEQAALQESEGQQGYWRSFWDTDSVFYGHVLGCKGLERRAVVLCVNDAGTNDRARERLYVGLSRATDRLVVVGDPEVLRAAGGPEVARRLGLPV